jgi:hypothetical protein
LYKFQFSGYASPINSIYSTQRSPPTVGRTAPRLGNVIRVAKMFVFVGVHYRNGCCHPPSNTYLVAVITSSETFVSPPAPLFKRNWKSPASYAMFFIHIKTMMRAPYFVLLAFVLTPSPTGIKVPHAVSTNCKSFSVKRDPWMRIKC